MEDKLGLMVHGSPRRLKNKKNVAFDKKTYEMVSQIKTASTTERFLFYPDSRVVLWSTRMRVTLLLYNFFSVPTRMAFGFNDFARQDFTWFLVDVFVDLLFLLDVAFHFRTVVKGPDGELLTEPSEIARHYLKNDFHRDFWPCIVHYGRFALWDSFWWNFLFSSPLIVRVSRLATYFSDLEADYTKDVRKTAYLKFMLFIFGGSWWLGCLMFSIARAYDFSPETYLWFTEPSLKPNPLEASRGDQILISVLWGFQATSAQGYANYVPMNLGEMIAVLLMILLQTILYAFILSTIFSYIVKEDEFVAVFRSRMLALESYIEARKLPTDLATHIRSYYDFQLKNASVNKVVDELPETLKMKVAMFVDGDMVQNISIFKNCEERFLKRLLIRMRSMTLMPGEQLIKCKDMSRELFFLKQGKMEICSSDGQPIRFVGPGHVLGELTFFLGLPQPYTVKAKAHNTVTLSVLSREDYDSLLADHPGANDRIVKHLLSSYGVGKRSRKDKKNTSPNGPVTEKERIKLLIEKVIAKQNEEHLIAMTYAASAGLLEEVKRIILMGLDVNMGDCDARTTLHVASSEGNMKVVQLLIEQGADVNARDRWGRTPLNNAIMNQHEGVANILQNAGGQLNFKNASAMMRDAVKTGNLTLLKILVDHGVDPNQRDYDHRTALHVAASEGLLSVAEYLIHVKADVNCVDRWGVTPLSCAVMHKQRLVARILRDSGGEIRFKDPAGELCSAANAGDLVKLKMLIENGLDANCSNYDQRTALHLAAAEGQFESAELLVFLGANVNALDHWNHTPLTAALLSESYGVAKVLIANGGSVKPEYQHLLDDARGTIDAININKVRQLLKQKMSSEHRKQMNERNAKHTINTLKQIDALAPKFLEEVNAVREGIRSKSKNLQYEIESKMREMRSKIREVKNLEEILSGKKSSFVSKTEEKIQEVSQRPAFVPRLTLPGQVFEE